MSKKIFTVLLLAVFMLAQFSIASAAVRSFRSFRSYLSYPPSLLSYRPWASGRIRTWRNLP